MSGNLRAPESSFSACERRRSDRLHPALSDCPGDIKGRKAGRKSGRRQRSSITELLVASESQVASVILWTHLRMWVIGIIHLYKDYCQRLLN